MASVLIIGSVVAAYYYRSRKAAGCWQAHSSVKALLASLPTDLAEQIIHDMDEIVAAYVVERRRTVCDATAAVAAPAVIDDKDSGFESDSASPPPSPPMTPPQHRSRRQRIASYFGWAGQNNLNSEATEQQQQQLPSLSSPSSQPKFDEEAVRAEAVTALLLLFAIVESLKKTPDASRDDEIAILRPLPPKCFSALVQVIDATVHTLQQRLRAVVDYDDEKMRECVLRLMRMGWGVIVAIIEVEGSKELRETIKDLEMDSGHDGFLVDAIDEVLATLDKQRSETPTPPAPVAA